MNKIYLVGKNINYSLSSRIYKMFGVECEIKNITSEEELKTFIQKKDFAGFNVTIPYKENVIKYLDDVSDTAKKTNVVNTVKNDNGKLIGYNTDYYGISKAFSGIDFKNKKTLILGSGATSRTVRTYCIEQGCEPMIISRQDSKYNYVNISQHYDAEIVINTTPVSGANMPDEKLIDITKFKNLQYALDVNYLPHRTQLSNNTKAKYLGGLPMLIWQAMKSYEIYTGKIPNVAFEEVYKKTLFDTINISLIGMPCVGKTTVGEELASRLNRTYIDLDCEIEKRADKTIEEIFNQSGEEYFRDLEINTLKRFGYANSQIISTGGGVILREENRRLLKANSIIVELRTNREIKDYQGRPVLKTESAYKKLQSERAPLYGSLANVVVYNDKKIENTVEEIIKEVEEFINEKNTSY